MQETLVIEISKDNPMRPSWICFDAAAQVIDEAIAGDPTLLPALTLDREVIVLVPANDTLLLNVQLPPMNKQRLMQALPFALEEELLQDVEALHIAPLSMEHSKEGNIPVLVVTHALMQEWMQLLKSMGVSPNVVTSLLFAIPYSEDEVTILLQDPLLLRLDRYKAYVVDPENLALMLSPSAMEKTQKTVTVYRDASYSAPMPFMQDAIVHEKVIDKKTLLKMMGHSVLSVEPINLLQGRYFSRKIRLPKGLLFQTLVAMIACFIVLLMAYPMVSYLILGSQLRALDRDVAVIYKKQFPDAVTVKAPRAKMEERITQLTSAANENKLLLLLAYFGNARKEVPSVNIQHLNYSDQETVLELTAGSALDVSRFTDKLSQQGLRITQQNANISGEKVSVNLLVRLA